MRPFVPAGPHRYAHQRRGLNALIRTKGQCALLFDPGTGKTATTLDYASILALKSPTREARVLVVAPLAAIDTWVDQAETYVHDDVAVWAEALRGSMIRRASILALRGRNPLPPKKADYGRTRSMDAPGAAGFRGSAALTVRLPGGATPDPSQGPEELPGPRLLLLAVNLDTFASRATVRGSSETYADLMIDAVKRFQPDLLVVDESHRIKSVSSNTSKALARLNKFVPRRVLLTGTVMPHSPLDVFGQWRFMAPYAFGYTDRRTGQRRPSTFNQFKYRYAQMGGWMGKEVVGFRNLDEMQEVMAENSVVARKADALDLPETTDVTVRVDLSRDEAKAYEDMKSDLAAKLADGTLTAAPNRLAQMMRLRQITSGYLPDVNGTPQELGESKARVIRSIVHDNLAGEKRIVVFAHFRHEISQLERMLSAKDTEILTITGDTSTADRLAIRRRFGVRPEDDPTRLVMIAQTRTMSLAVNELVTASHAIYGSLSQLRDDWVQSRDRLHRIGARNAITYWIAVAPKTIDEVILEAHRNRTSLEDAVLAHIQGK